MRNFIDLFRKEIFSIKILYAIEGDLDTYGDIHLRYELKTPFKTYLKGINDATTPLLNISISISILLWSICLGIAFTLLAESLTNIHLATTAKIFIVALGATVVLFKNSFLDLLKNLKQFLNA